MTRAMLNRRSLMAAAALTVATTATASGRQKIIVTGDMGTVGTRLRPLLSNFDIVGIDKKRGDNQDLAARDVAIATDFFAFDAMVHLAWDTFTHADMGGILYNTWITREALAAAKLARVRHFIFASSAWAAPDLYGRKGGIEPTHHYTENKLFLEGMLRRFCPDYGMKISAIRFGHVKAGAEPSDDNFDARIVMSDRDLIGLVRIALHSEDSFRLIGPFDAR